MKKIYNMIIACLGILLLFACEADKEGMGGVGYLRLGVVESNDVITKAEETYDAEVFTVTITNKNVLEPIRKCMAGKWQADKRYKVTGFFVTEAKTMCFALEAGVQEDYRTNGTAI